MITDILLIPIMAFISRMCGGGKPKLQNPIDQILYALPFIGVAFLLLMPTVPPLGYQYPWHIWVLAGLAGVTAFLGKIIGHGRGISIGEPMKPGSKPERVELVILWLQPHVPNWLYKSLILLLCEAIVWAGIAVVSPLLILGAFIRPVAYLIGWYGQKVMKPTAAGEYLTGAMAGGLLGYVVSLST